MFPADPPRGSLFTRRGRLANILFGSGAGAFVLFGGFCWLMELRAAGSTSTGFGGSIGRDGACPAARLAQYPRGGNGMPSRLQRFANPTSESSRVGATLVTGADQTKSNNCSRVSCVMRSYPPGLLRRVVAERTRTLSATDKFGHHYQARFALFVHAPLACVLNGSRRANQLNRIFAAGLLSSNMCRIFVPGPSIEARALRPSR
jgi:hypothetical protein